MDEWLDERGLFRKNNALDGTCLFRAVAEFLIPANPVSGHLILRQKCVDYIQSNREQFESRIPTDFEEYVNALAQPKTWGTAVELDAISLMYKVDFEVFHGPENPLPVTDNGFSKVLLLCVTGNTFYDAVYTKEQISNLGFCQSIVYHTLYEKVFKLEDLDYAVDKMLHDKEARAQRERYLSNQSVSREHSENDLYLENPDSPIKVINVVDSGAIIFPYKVAKALDPDIYRNTDFDAWVESHRGKPSLQDPLCLCQLAVSRRNHYWFGNGGPLRVGVKCHVRVDDRILTGHIQEMTSNSSPVVVFIEEYSKKLTVNYDALIPMPRSSLRPDWSYSQKHQMINKLSHKAQDDGPDNYRRRSRSQRKDESTSTASLCGDLDRLTFKSDTVKDDSVIPEPDSTSTPQKPIKRSLIITPMDSRCLVNPAATPSVQPDGSDLPYDDLETLRFFFNLGLEYFRLGTVAYGPPLKPPEEYPPMAMMGVPMFSPMPPNLHIPDLSMTPGVHACQGSPIIATLPPSPVMAPMPVVCAPMTPTELPPLQTPVKERSKNAKFSRPPRFQRRDSVETKKNNDSRTADEVQQPEVSSTTAKDVSPLPFMIPPPPLLPFDYTGPVSVYQSYPIEGQNIEENKQLQQPDGSPVGSAPGPFTLPPPPPGLMQLPYHCQPVNYSYSVDGEVHCDVGSYCEIPYPETPSYIPEHLPHDRSPMYTEMPPEMAYPFHFGHCYPPVQVYYQ